MATSEKIANLKRKAEEWEEEIFYHNLGFKTTYKKLTVAKIIQYIREENIVNNENNRGSPYDKSATTSSVVWPKRKKNQTEVMEAHMREQNQLSICVRSDLMNSNNSRHFNIKHVESRKFHLHDKWVVFDGWNRLQTIMDIHDGRSYMYKTMDSDHKYNRMYFSEEAKEFAMSYDPDAVHGMIMQAANRKTFLQSMVTISFWVGSKAECEHQAYLLNTKQTDMSKFEEIKLILAKDPMTSRKQYVQDIMNEANNDFLQAAGMSGEGQKMVACLVMKTMKPNTRIYQNTHSSSIQLFFEFDQDLEEHSKIAVGMVLKILSAELAPRIKDATEERVKEILFAFADMLMDTYLERKRNDDIIDENILMTESFKFRARIANVCANRANSYVTELKTKKLVNYLKGQQ